MDDVDALLEAAQGQLNSSLSNRDYGAALRSLERLKAAILGAEDVSASEAEADDASVPSTSDWSETDDQARQSVALRPVASLSVQPDTNQTTTETALVVSSEHSEDVDFVSDAASLRKVLGLASGSSSSIALHRLGGALVLDAGVDDAWGDVDPETGEVATGAAGAFCAGALAGVVSTAVCYPLETVRTRMGVDPGAYRGMLDCVRQLALSSGGVRTLYGGIGASMTGVIPYAALNLGTYDTLQRGYRLYTGEDKVPKEVCGLCGAVAGPLAATATFPLEVVRRRMMMGAGYSSVLEALRVIWATEGGRALFRGCGLSWLKLAPSAGITFMVYELVKEELQVSR